MNRIEGSRLKRLQHVSAHFGAMVARWRWMCCSLRGSLERGEQISYFLGAKGVH